jgi:hypothetical protein
MVKEKRQCKECGDEIHGRRDKQFCSDQCRACHHNNLNSDISNDIRRTNYILRKNRTILAKLNPNGKIKVHKIKLVDHGLHFDYYTNVYKTRSGKTYYFCYDQGYLELEEELYALVVKRDYVG